MCLRERFARFRSRLATMIASPIGVAPRGVILSSAARAAASSGGARSRAGRHLPGRLEENSYRPSITGRSPCSFLNSTTCLTTFWIERRAIAIFLDGCPPASLTDSSIDPLVSTRIVTAIPSAGVGAPSGRLICARICSTLDGETSVDSAGVGLFDDDELWSHAIGNANRGTNRRRRMGQLL